MESAPTDLMVVLKFVCRGGYYPPVVYKISLRFARDAEDVVPYRFGGGFDVLVVGAIHESPVNKM